MTQHKHWNTDGNRPQCDVFYNNKKSGVPSQPSNFRATDIGETDVVLQWSKPIHSNDNIVQYELYWNDTYANEAHHK